MKKSFITVYTLLLLALLFTGCSTVDVANNFNDCKITINKDKPIAHIHASNYGYYLFSYIPLWTGRPGHANGCSFFLDQVTVGKMVDQVTKKSQELGGTKTINLSSNVLYTGSFSLWIIWLKEVHVSGDAVK